MSSRHLEPLVSKRGGVALEYVLVSTFAAVVTLTALGFIGKAVHAELDRLAAKLGLDSTVDWVEPFDGG